MQSVHGPWEAPGESVALFNDSSSEEHFIKDTLRQTYAGMLRELDYTVQNVTDALEAAGMWHERSLLVLTSDKCVRPSAPPSSAADIGRPCQQRRAWAGWSATKQPASARWEGNAVVSAKPGGV